MTEAWASGTIGVPPALWACLSVHSCSQTHSPCMERAQLQQLRAALLLSPAHISHQEVLGKIPLQCGHLFNLDLFAMARGSRGENGSSHVKS